MTRKDAIKTLKELWRETNDPWYEEVYNMAINALEADRPQGEWIPCSERLPSDGQNVIIQYYDTTEKNHVSVVGACYDDQQGFVDTGYEEMWFGNGNDDVIAWMPLPKPYTGDGCEISYSIGQTEREGK